MIYLLYLISLFGLTLYSYALIDLNLTLINTHWWLAVREPFIQLGYFNRGSSVIIYLVLISLLSYCHLTIVSKSKEFSIYLIAITTAVVLFFSYPFLSHDFFNYIFDAKILTFYGQNPYLHKALDYPTDDWLRFMHWTHRSYPYGPVFLILTLIPSFFAMGKFILNYFFFKGLFVGFYLLTVYILSKFEKKQALLFATHPLVLVEGLISAHNDLIAVSLGIVGLYFLMHKKKIASRLLFLTSGLIKFTTLPIIFLSPHRKSYINIGVFILTIGLLAYLSWTREIQQWYFLTLFVFLPLYPVMIRRLFIFFVGLLLSYYPYIYMGGWDKADEIALKHAIIAVGFFINAVVIIVHDHKKIRLAINTIRSNFL